MKKKLFIILFIIFIPAGAYAINAILGGAVYFKRGPYPTVVHKLSTSGVYEPSMVNGATFLGARNTSGTNNRLFNSNAGVIWSALTLPVTGLPRGLDTSGNRYIQLQGITQGGCGVYYSDDQGVNWTLVQLNDAALGSGLDNCQPTPGFADGLYCLSSTCIAAGINLNTIPLICPNVPCLITAVSTDSGSNWTSVQPPQGDVNHRVIRGGKVMIFSETNVVVTSDPGTTCANGGSVQFPVIATSTNSGGSYATTYTGDTICWYFWTGSKLDNTYIIVATDSNATNPIPIFWTSTNLTTWSQVTPVLTPSITSSNPGDISLRCYSNYTKHVCYYSVHDLANTLLRIYTSEDGVNFSQIYSETSTVTGTGVGRFVQDNSLLIYFGTSLTQFYSIDFT